MSVLYPWLLGMWVPWSALSPLMGDAFVRGKDMDKSDARTLQCLSEGKSTHHVSFKMQT